MAEQVTLFVNNRPVTVGLGTFVAAAIARSGAAAFRRSATGEARGPICGMGVCFECRVTIDGQPHARSCQILCQPDMRVSTDE